MGLDHVMLKVKDWQKAKRYYTAALKPLGYEPVVDFGAAVGGGFAVPGEKAGNIYIVQGSPHRHSSFDACSCACLPVLRKALESLL